MEYTIAEDFTLPSLGKIYKKEVSPYVKVRSMTTREEMQRLNPSDRVYKPLCDVIDSCLVESPGISCYDMCLGDYIYLLHKVRIVTYGPKYKTSTVCPYCGCSHDIEISLEDLDIKTYSEDILKYLEIDLPQTKHHVVIKPQTPRMLDEIELRAKEQKKKNSKGGDYSFLLYIQAMIDTIDGIKPNIIQLEDFVSSLPMLDAQYILRYSEKFNEELGVDTRVQDTCDICKLEFVSSFRITQEFFRPTLDI